MLKLEYHESSYDSLMGDSTSSSKPLLLSDIDCYVDDHSLIFEVIDCHATDCSSKTCSIMKLVVKL